MIHRVGALVIGLVLVSSIIKFKNQNTISEESKNYSKFLHATAGFWFLNLLIGASYVIFAESGDFPEWLSLLHLVGGVSCFLIALICPFMIRLSMISKRTLDRE